MMNKRISKKQVWQRILSLVLTVCLLAEFLPLMAMAREAETPSPAAGALATPAAAAAKDAGGAPAAVDAGASARTAAETHWAAGVIHKWISQALLNSKSLEEFRPDDAVTRAEFVTMINNLFGFVQKGGAAFSDVPPDAWYHDAVLKATAAGIVTGDGNGKFRPDSSISRQEAAVLLARVFSLPAEPRSALGAFKDVSDVADWSMAALNSLTAKGYITGRPGKLLAPKDSCTRAESLKMIDNLAGRIIGKSGTYNSDCEGNVTVNQSDVVLRDMTIAGDLFLTQGVGDGTVTLDRVTVKGRTVVKGGGAHSIVVNNSSLIGTLLVLKQDGKIRIVAQGDTSIAQTSLGSGGTLENTASSGTGFGSVEILGTIEAGQNISLAGDFSAVSVEASGVSLEVQSGTVGTLEVAQGVTQSQITVNTGAVVSVLTANAPVSVTGQGTIGTANINSSSVVIEKSPENVVVATGVSATVGGQTVTGSNTQPPTVSGASGGSGGSSSSVTVTGVAAIAGISVRYGTDKAAVGLPPTVTVMLSSGGSAAAGVTWDDGTPAYNAQTAGTYVFSGTLALTGSVTNPGGLKASAAVTVLARSVHRVIFAVSDGTNPLRDAIVAVPGNAVVSTGAEGTAEIGLADGTYSYSVTAVGYNGETGTVTVAGADMVKTVVLSVSSVTLYTVTFESNGGSAADSQRLASGVRISQMITPAKTGHTFTGWYRDSSLTTLWDFAKDTVPANDITLYAGWTVSTYTLRYTAEANGAITGAATQTVRYGAGGTTVKAMADTGYQFFHWSDGASLVYASRTDLNVMRDIAAKAIFAPRKYTLSYAAGANGSVTGSLSQTVTYGASGTPVTAVAATGYHFVKWSDGATANPRTDSSVAGAVSATAEFARDQLVFSVSDSVYAVSGATVLIWTQGTDPDKIAALGQTAVSDPNGRAAFALSTGSYNYSVFKAVYAPATGNVTVDSSGMVRTVPVTLAPCAPIYTASVTTYFREINNSVLGGSVELIGIGVSNADADTNIFQHTFQVGSGVYYYKASYSSTKVGTYLTGGGSVTVAGQNIAVNAYMDYLKFDVTLTVTDGVSPIAGAKVYVNDPGKSSAPLTTNLNGTVVYPDYYMGYGFRYIVSREGHDDFTGYLLPNLNHTAYTVTPPYGVTFSLSAGGSPVVGARVTLGNESDVTDANGRLSFSVQGGQSYSYAISSFYCAPASGSVTVSAQDVSVPLALTALATHSLTLTVTDSGSGAPVQGAQAVLTKQADYSFDIPAITDMNGRAVFQAPDGLYGYTVTKEQYDTVYGSAAMAGADRSLGASMTTVNRTVTLTVKDSSGSHVLQGISVIVGSTELTTDTNGSAVFTLTDGSYGFQASASGYADLTGGFWVRGASETLTLFLQPSAVYAVTIHAADTSGNPVWNVSMARDGDASISFGGQTVLYLVNGSYSYTLTAPGYGSAALSFTVSGAATSQTATMTPAQKYKLTFTVFDENNVVLSGATVTLSNGDWAYTDSSGQAAFSEYPGAYTYTVKAYLKTDLTGSVTLGSADQTKIVSQSALVSHVTYQVMDASGTALSGASVTADSATKTTAADGIAQFALAYGSYPFTVTAPGYVNRGGTTEVRGADVTTNVYMPQVTNLFQVVVTDSVYSIPNAAVTIGTVTAPITDMAGSTALDIPNGTYAYSVSCPGYAAATGTVTVSGPGVLDVVLTKQGGVSVTVVSQNYLRPSAEQVSVTINGITNTIVSASIAADYPLSTHFTLDAGTYPVSVHAAGYQDYSGSITVTATAKDFTILLTPSAYTATLTVTGGAGPVSGAAVTLASYDGLQTAATGTDGTATFSNVSYNRQYYYTVSKAGYQGISSFNSASSFIVAGNTARAVTLTGLPIRVQVRSASTTYPVQGATVTAGGVTQPTDANGYAIFTPSGGTSLAYTVSAPSFSTAAGSLDLSGGADSFTVPLALLTQRVTFTVREGTNPYKTLSAEPIDGAQIIAASTASSGNATAFTGNDGTAALDLPMGSNTCYVYKAGYSPRSMLVNVTQDASQTVILEPEVYSNSVTVTGLDDAALAGATVSCNGTVLGTTNATGVLSFSMPAGSYTLTFSAEGYYSALQGVQLSPVHGQTVSKQLEKCLYPIVVNVGDSSGPLPGATVTVGRAASGSAGAVTDAAGRAMFLVYHGQNSYSVTMPGYGELNGTAAVTGDTALNLTLTKALYNVTLCVQNKVGGGVYPVHGATVLVGTQSVATGADGLAKFSLLSGAYTYSVTKNNFNTLNGGFTVGYGDMSVNAVLSAVNMETFHVYDMTSYILNGLPSPVDDAGLPPLAGAAVVVYTADENRPAATGVTDGNGVAILNLGSFSDTYNLKYKITKEYYTDLLANAAAAGSFNITATTVTSARMYKSLKTLGFVVTDAGSGRFRLASIYRWAVITPRRPTATHPWIYRLASTAIPFGAMAMRQPRAA